WPCGSQDRRVYAANCPGAAKDPPIEYLVTAPNGCPCYRPPLSGLEPRPPYGLLHLRQHQGIAERSTPRRAQREAPASGFPARMGVGRLRDPELACERVAIVPDRRHHAAPCRGRGAIPASSARRR